MKVITLINTLKFGGQPGLIRGPKSRHGVGLLLDYPVGMLTGWDSQWRYHMCCQLFGFFGIVNIVPTDLCLVF